MSEHQFLGEHLVKRGIITEAQLNEALSESKTTNRRLGEILVQRGFASEEDIAQALSDQLGINFVDLRNCAIEPAAVTMIPKEVAVKLKAIAVSRTDDALNVVMADPLNVAAIDELSSITGGVWIKPFFGTPTGIEDAINKYYARTEKEGAPSAGVSPLSRPRPGPTPTTIPQPEQNADRLLHEAEQESVIKIVNNLFDEAVKTGASDIHLEPQQDDFYCRLRIDGTLYDTQPPPKKYQSAVISRIKIIAEMDIAQTRIPQDGRIQLKILKKDVDLRVATFPTIYGEHVAIRLLDRTQGVKKLDEMGIRQETLTKFREIIRKPYGIVLVTGPTGSGKTTTLYGALNVINDLKKNIVTIEDPVEYSIERIHQSQVNVKAGFTFASGLRSIVRLDPDIIMIGEIRDQETADIAVHAALTGHLVFSTLHTNDAASAATRLVNIGIEPYLVASALTGILAQRLVRMICQKCKEKSKPNPSELALLKNEFPTRKDLAQAEIFKAPGCRYCHQIGYQGRTGIFELLIPDQNIKELIIAKAPAHKIKQAAAQSGLQTLRQDGFQKALDGITSLSEVLAVTDE